ncbi:cytochrome c oxidase assembly factor CtaG [Micromonospora kangleipakensis]|uniref:Cytochrome c oxidase assembly factor CtaG n=1 Tax=Micromonospora kangleipakensis TaxID=1077942 RepID=A0A4Q8BBX2_9ACTN|nr:cytochrome c oxidase assembly protein [Micromonospora kangleipakensis]RZU75322.1 cytochrome c oxidase assembly factor CtaG [Micromonospora kangleipakensis]
MSALTAHRAHQPGQDPVAEGLLTMLAVVTLCLLVAGYGRGVQELWARRGVGRVVPVWRVAAFGVGVLTVLAAEQGPVHELAESSFAGHMAQHMLLLLVAGPLLAAGAAGLPLSLAAPVPLRRLLARWRVAPAVRRLRRSTTYALLAGGGQTVVLWFWHLPGPYAAAVDRPAVHAAEHLSLLATAWLFWVPVLGPPRHRAPAPVTVLLLVGAMLPASALGAVLTFAPAPVYPDRMLGADPLADQQLAGLLMWAPMDLVVLVVALSVFLRWLLRMDRDRPDALAGGPLRRGGGPVASRPGTEGMVR